MPVLPLPVGGAPLSGGDLPVVDQVSIAAVEPYIVSSSDIAPVRDGIRAGLVALYTGYQPTGAQGYQQTSSIASAQCDPLRATGTYLDGLGKERGILRQASELDTPYRARIIMSGAVVSPNAICAATNAILAPYTAIPCKYLESVLDRAYVYDGTSPHVAYVTAATGASLGSSNPSYNDRYYPDDAVANGGISIPNRGPGGFWSFGDCIGRFFVLRVPSLAALDASVVSVYNGLPAGGAAEAAGLGFYASDGSLPSPASWTFVGVGQTVAGVYSAIAQAVQRLVGHSIRWSLFSDPTLTQ